MFIKVTNLPINHRDQRGVIQDIFAANAPECVTMITSMSGAVRGNHVHMHTVQHVFIVSGSMWAYSRAFGDDAEVGRVRLAPGDLLRHDVGEEHAYEAIETTVFLAFAQGIRKGSSYEDDTLRVPSLIERYRQQLAGRD